MYRSVARSCQGPLCVSRWSATMPQTCLFSTRSDADAGRPIDGSTFDKQRLNTPGPIMTIERIGQDFWFMSRLTDELLIDGGRPIDPPPEGSPCLPGCFTCHCLRRLAIFQIDNMRECANPIGRAPITTQNRRRPSSVPSTWNQCVMCACRTRDIPARPVSGRK